ncbi:MULTISPECIES: MFS transporter [unclassified Brevibacterium]|uniref:MFS transporter n=1 Tax=unclassified Brevibacterium TaxID=2614124 RepID=UPI0010F8D2CC|nr:MULTISPECIES: MFS transporter [unclassified Brevibacterium]MCM1011064.1 hypothetical protein [Brevibacterium sp. XM4083]
MLTRRKNVMVTGLFVLGICGFVLGLAPELAAFFWVLWFIGCGASMLGLILAVTVPRPAAERHANCRGEAGHCEAGRRGGSDDGSPRESATRMSRNRH